MEERNDELLTKNPILTAILEAAGVVLMLIDRQRQILFANTDLLKTIGLESAQTIIGFRPGEALRCIHAADNPAGCGTTLHCETCGVNQAILASQQTGQPTERECLLAVERNNRQVALEYLVRASPITIVDRLLTVVSFRDISADKRREILERVFFHDILNTITGLKGNLDLLRDPHPVEAEQVIERITFLINRLRREIIDQRSLLQAESGTLRLRLAPVHPDEILRAVEATFAGQLERTGKKLEVTLDPAAPGLITDTTILVRVITNMVKNALEATDREGMVRLWAESDGASCTFRVWNSGEIPDHIALQIFMRSFSTKQGRGRGLGTYSMKLLGEQYLGGRVTFSTSKTGGTEFCFNLPLEAARG